MTRCKAVHDVAPHPYRILRCEREAGHAGPHKPAYYEPISKVQYEAFAKRLRRASA